jgi:hypothetical protein
LDYHTADIWRAVSVIIQQFSSRLKCVVVIVLFITILSFPRIPFNIEALGSNEVSTPQDKIPLLASDSILLSTYVGGNADDTGYAIDVDSVGRIYVAGFTKSSNFPSVDSSKPSSNADCYVLRINAQGNAIDYVTYLGGSDYDAVFDIAVDNLGCVYATGVTESDDFPIVGGFHSSLDSSNDAFVFKLSETGSILYSSYIGEYRGVGGGVDFDASGCAYVTGYFEDGSLGQHCFVTKVNAMASSLVYSKYVYAYADETSGKVTRGRSIAVDSENQAYVTGYTSDATFPTVNAYDETISGSTDAIIFKLSSGGDSYVFSSFLGGSSDEFGESVVIDSSDNIYIGGYTRSSDFQLTTGSRSGGSDCFVVKFDSLGQELAYSNVIGGQGDDWLSTISVDLNGNVYAIGDTTSISFPTVQSLDSGLSGGQDCIFYQLDPDGRVVFSSYFGGSNSETGNSVAIDVNGVLYLTGGTKSNDLQTNNILDDSHNSGWDCYLLKLNISSVGSAALGIIEIASITALGITVIVVVAIIYWIRIRKPASLPRTMKSSGPPPEIV